MIDGESKNKGSNSRASTSKESLRNMKFVRSTDELQLQRRRLCGRKETGSEGLDGGLSTFQSGTCSLHTIHHLQLVSPHLRLLPVSK